MRAVLERVEDKDGSSEQSVRGPEGTKNWGGARSGGRFVEKKELSHKENLFQGT